MIGSHAPDFFHGSFSEGDAWFLFFVWRCEGPRLWVPAFVRGAEWLWDFQGRRYGPTLTGQSTLTSRPMAVNTWRHTGRFQDSWQDLGFSATACV